MARPGNRNSPEACVDATAGESQPGLSPVRQAVSETESTAIASRERKVKEPRQKAVPPAIRRAMAVGLPGGADLDELIAATIHECLEHFTSNRPAFLEQDQPQAVHQLRVSLRRLRVFLAMFARHIPNEKFGQFRAQASAISDAMAVARDMDVFIDMVIAGPAQIFAGPSSSERRAMDDEGMRLFLAACERRRAEGYGSAHAVLAAPQSARFVEDLRCFADMRGWRTQIDHETCARLDQPAKKFVARVLGREDRKCRKMGARIATFDEDQRHRLRIRFKHLRYGVDTFGKIAGGRKRRSSVLAGYTGVIAKIQNQLGLFNDLATAFRIVESLPAVAVDEPAAKAFARASGMVLGWCAHAQSDASHQSVAAYQEFATTPPPWD